MADRPIIFSGPMVRALLAGNKTQTRRVAKPEPRLDHFASEQLEDFELRGLKVIEQPDGRHLVYQAIWRAGDRLWVRENVRADELPDGQDGVRYLADEEWLPIESSREAADRWVDLNHYGSTAERPCRGRKMPSIHMPRWASRLTLTVTEVRVERLNDISEADARAEGCGQYASSTPILREFRPEWKGSYRQGFLAVWDQLHGTESTDANLWVAAISFRVIPANIDSLPERP